MRYVFRVWLANVNILTASETQAAATMAFVEATAGMMFFTTPIVSMYVTPLILNSSARALAFSKTHFMSSGESLSSLEGRRKRVEKKEKWRRRERGRESS